MKLILRILCSIGMAVTTVAQNSSPPTPPDLQISEIGWAEYHSRMSRDYSSTITVDDAAARERREKSRQNSRDETAGTKSLPSAPDPSVIGPKALAGRPWGYSYKMTVENNGARKIKTIVWEYLFLDPLNRNVIGRHKFLSKVKVNPGERKVVSGISTKKPMQIVRAEAAHLPPIEQIIIKRATYSDGSVWEP